MKYLPFLPLFFLSLFVTAQIEVPISNIKKGFIIECKEPYDSIRVSFEDDLTEYFSRLIFTDTTLIFKNGDDKYDYDKKKFKIDGENSKKTKAKTKGTKLGESGTQEILKMDISMFVDERSILKPGLEVEIKFDQYIKTQKNVIQSILIKTDFNSIVRITGLFEKFDGSFATVDGQKVTLKEGVNLVGKEGFEGKKFTSFKDMMYGMIVDGRGKRQTDGILVLENGYVKPDQYTDIDRKISTSYKSIMKRSANGDEITVADTITIKVLQNLTVQTYINRIANTIIPKYIKELPDNTPGKIDFNFFVIKDPSFNACAYPDGTIHIHTGLLEKIDNDAQLAAIIGHEIGHVVYKHSRKNYEKNKTKNIISDLSLFGTLLGIRGADIAFLATAIGGPILLSSYSRDLEEQADRIGLSYLYEANFDPREAPKIWQKLAFEDDVELPSGSILEALALGGEKGIQSIYSSHPEAAKRYRNLSLLIAKNYQNVDLSQTNTGAEMYGAFKKSLSRILKGLPEKEEVRAEVPTPRTNDSKKVKKESATKTTLTNPKAVAPKSNNPKTKSKKN